MRADGPGAVAYHLMSLGRALECLLQPLSGFASGQPGVPGHSSQPALRPGIAQMLCETSGPALESPIADTTH